MMQKVRLRIDTDIDGSVSSFRSNASLEEGTDGIVVRYKLEDDDGMLRFEKNAMSMERSGEVNLRARFSTCEESYMTTELAQACGEIPIRTQSYVLKRFSKTILVELNYFILFENSQSKVKIKIMVVA